MPQPLITRRPCKKDGVGMEMDAGGMRAQTWVMASGGSAVHHTRLPTMFSSVLIKKKQTIRVREAFVSPTG